MLIIVYIHIIYYIIHIIIVPEINLGKFEYQRYFPNSPKCEFFSSLERKKVEISVDNLQSLPSFSSFAETWLAEKEVEWRESQQITSRCT